MLKMTFFTTTEYVNEQDFYESVRQYIVSVEFKRYSNLVL